MAKPGMHQIAKGDPKNRNELPISLKELVDTMAGIKPVHSIPHNRGIGKKCFIQAESKSKHFVIEFFSELVVSDKPSDPSMGYAANDVSQYRGVMMTSYEPQADHDGYHHNYGEIIPYDEFVERYVHSSELRVRLDRIMEMMEDSVQVNDNFLESANNFWENRDPGTKSISFNVLH